MNIVLLERLYQKWIVQKRTEDNVYKDLKALSDDWVDKKSVPFEMLNYKEVLFGIVLEAVLRCYLDDAYRQTLNADEKGVVYTDVDKSVLFPYLVFVMLKTSPGIHFITVCDAAKEAITITAGVALLLNKYLEE